MYLNKKYFSAVDFSKCKMTKMGLDFNGDVSTSASGKNMPTLGKSVLAWLLSSARTSAFTEKLL